VLYPALFEIQVRFPNRYFRTKEAWSRLGNMACLNWKSDALATVVRPLPKGTGDPPKRHLWGNNLKTRIEISDSGFFIEALNSWSGEGFSHRWSLQPFIAL